VNVFHYLVRADLFLLYGTENDMEPLRFAA